MRTTIYAALFVGTLVAPAFAGDVSLSVTVGQPGFYGQLNIGNIPQLPAPQLIYAQPVVIQRAPEFVAAPPVYLHVPPGHEKHWSKHCAEYNACGRPVYFVRDDWYYNEYVYHYQQHEQGNEGHGHGHDHEGHGHGHDKD